MSTAIEVTNLRITRGSRTVIPSLSLHLESGSVTGLLGPSGCGKTTLMRALVGVQKVESGQVVVLGLPAGTPALRTRVAYVTQSRAIYNDLSVVENLRYFAKLLHVPKSRIAEVLELVGLTGRENQPVHQLSGGEESRVSLATALLGSPEILVLDEPTVGVDPILRRSLWQTFRTLAAAGTTLLVSSHVMDEATHCDSLLLMRQGQILTHTSAQKLMDSTHTTDMDSAFVALIEDLQ